MPTYGLYLSTLVHEFIGIYVRKLSNIFISNYEKVIIISTKLEFDDLNIHGELFILTTDNSILFIKDKLNKILDEL